MFKHILIPTDGSPLAELAVDRGIRLAAELHARVTLLTVTQPYQLAGIRPSMRADEYAPYAERHGRELLAGGMALANFLGVQCDPIVVEDEQPYASVIDVAVSQDCDLIAMASHGRRGISAYALGSQTQSVLTHSKVPVLVFR